MPDTLVRHRFSVDAYHRMGEAGILLPGERTELIDGEIIQMPPVGSPHIGAVLALTRLLTQAVPADVIVSVQNPIQLGDRNEPEPDIALLRGRADGYRTPPPPAAADALLIIEVSDTAFAPIARTNCRSMADTACRKCGSSTWQLAPSRY